MKRRTSGLSDKARETVEQVRPHIGPILDAFTGPDAKGRSIAAEEILRRGVTTPLFGAIVDLAVERLVCVAEAEQSHVVDGLCRLGQPAVVHLVYHLGRSKGERARVLLVEALATIGRTLANPDVVNLMMTLSIRVESDPSMQVRSAGAKAIAVLRRTTVSNAARNESRTEQGNGCGTLQVALPVPRQKHHARDRQFTRTCRPRSKPPSTSR